MASQASEHAQRNVEQTVWLLTALAGLPANVLLIAILWSQSYSFEVRWTIASVIVLVWLGAAAAARQLVTRTLYVSANLLGALREGDYSIRGASARPRGAVDLVMSEINALGDTLQRQRAEAIESTALLQSVMAAIDVAVFAFDMDGTLVLVNRAGEHLIGRPAAELVGRRAEELRLVAYLSGDVPRLIEQPFGPSSGRLELRRSRFRREGRPHDLLVFADLSRALREEEQQAWQRIVRVLSHEINNSLTPIKSIAHSVKRMIARAGDVPRAADIQEALTLIERRSGALGRFLRAYAQLARLPRPQPRPFDLAPLVHRVVDLEDRSAIGIRAASDMRVSADPDQLEQLLINIVRNAVDATLDRGGAVWIDWSAGPSGGVEIVVEDEGPGLPDTSNLFVPFFTTKPTGSGIGLALSRQIAEAHGGTLRLVNRQDRVGCRAVLSLPAGV
jgi:two-component system, NtrC family, nitrogen regulation sensor histidine kinase NtrY